MAKLGFVDGMGITVFGMPGSAVWGGLLCTANATSAGGRNHYGINPRGYLAEPSERGAGLADADGDTGNYDVPGGCMADSLDCNAIVV